MVPHFRRRTGPMPSATTALVELTPVVPLSSPRSVPSPYVGRVREQERALRLLQQRGVVAITGADGSGKTALVASVIAELALPTYCIDLRPGLNDHLDSCLWQLAQPLAQLAPNVWRTLHRIQQSGWSYPAIISAQMILAAYAGLDQEVVLWINIQGTIADLPLESLIAGICDYVAQTHHAQIKLIVEGTNLPYKVGAYALPNLLGLQPDMIHLWAERLTIDIGEEEARQIYQQTGGLPQAVALFFESLISEPEQTSLDQIGANPAIRKFVRHLLGPLAPIERAAVGQIIAEPQLHAPLSKSALSAIEFLEDRQLADCSTVNILIHPLIRSYYQHRQGR